MIVALVGLITIAVTTAAIAGAVLLIKQLIHSRSLEGQIERKLLELTNHREYMRELEDPSLSPQRREINSQYVELAKRKEHILETQYNALIFEKDRRRFEKEMEV